MVLKLTAILVSVSPCDLCMVLAAAGLNGNCFPTTLAVLFLPTANCAMIGLIGVHVGSIPCKYNCLLSCLVFSPTSTWSNCTQIIPDGLLLSYNVIFLVILLAPFVTPSSVLTFNAISVLSPSAS